MKRFVFAILVFVSFVPFAVAQELDCDVFDGITDVTYSDRACFLTLDSGGFQQIGTHEPLGSLYQRVRFERTNNVRNSQLACTTIEQARQICASESFSIGGFCDDTRELNCAREVTGLCHSALELNCDRFDLSAEQMGNFLSTAGISLDPAEALAAEEGTETYCTTQMIGDLGYSSTVPDRDLLWECTADERSFYGEIAEEQRQAGLPLLGWPIWRPDVGTPDERQNECRVFKALYECVLPNLGEAAACEVPREDCSPSGVPGCSSESPGVSYDLIQDRGLVHGQQVSRPYCFKLVNFDVGVKAHADYRAADFNNQIGQWNSGTLLSPAIPAQLNMPPDFVAIMETCGFTWGGRWYEAAVSDSGIVEGCDPMHFELPALGDERAAVDVFLVADNTGSMRDDLVALKIAGRAIVTVLSDLGVDFRMGIVTFNDPAVRLVVPLTADADTLIAGINSLGASGGGDFPEHVYGGLMEAIAQPWRTGAARGIVLIGDAPPKDPEPGTGHTLASVIEAARAGGIAVPLLAPPVEKAVSEAIRILSIQVGGNASTRFYFESLAAGTDGRLLVAPTADEVADAVIEALVELTVPSNLPPDVSAAAASVARLWPPNHQMTAIEIDGVVDPDGDAFSIRVTGIFQDEPVAGPGSGDTAPDGVGAGEAVASVRAERAGGGDGRVYRIEFVAEDERGAEAAGVVSVCVPHDRKRACTDGGALYDSTEP